MYESIYSVITTMTTLHGRANAAGFPHMMLHAKGAQEKESMLLVVWAFHQLIIRTDIHND